MVFSCRNGDFILNCRVLALLTLFAFVSMQNIGLAKSADTTIRVWTDSSSGYALGGFDPLSYFVDQRPRRGKAKFEHDLNGTIWKFTNSGNREAFARHPQYYLPAFGGYDPFALARQKTTIGLPTIWSLHKGRVYLFHNAVNRKLWEEDPEAHIAEAVDYWQIALKKLTN
ncbi:MAG: YHS domain-containing (seleno)protein [Methyloligellaceae bacterium]